jgi:signal peptide peptidase SppA
MKVIGYLESALWTMRSAEFGSMMRVAYQHTDRLDSLLDRVERPKSMLAKPGTALEGTRYIDMRDGVAVVDVNGIIAKRMDMFDEICYGGTSTEKLMKDFRTAIDSPQVQSIVLNIDSPGGEAFGINELSQAIYDARGKKPITAYVSGLGCSGAYWLASAADEVVTDKSAFLGSIGVVTAWTDDKGFYEALGIRRETIVSSNAPYKRLDFDNDAHRAELQRELDSIEKVFHKAVARNRKVTVGQVINDFNKGGVLAGADAVKAGMADRTGSLEEVIKELQLQKKRQMAAAASASATEDMDMGFRDEFKAFANRLGFNVQDEQEKPGDADNVDQDPGATPQNQPAQPQEEPAQPATQPAPATPPANVPQPEQDPAAAAMREELEAYRTQTIATQAESFVTAQVAGGKLLPAEKPFAVSLYAKLAAAGDAGGLEEFQSMISARKPHGLTTELVDAEANRVLLSEGGLSDAREKQLLNMTPLGKGVLSVIDGGKSKTASGR